jgi:hypothetical protein
MSEIHSLPQEIRQHIEEIARGIIPEAPDNMAPQQVIAYNTQVRTILDAICENIEHFLLLRLHGQGITTIESTVTTEKYTEMLIHKSWQKYSVVPTKSKTVETKRVTTKSKEERS